MFEKFNFRARLATNTILRGALRTCPKIFKSVTKLDNAALLRGKTISQSAAILSIGADFGELANSPRTIPVTEKIWRNNCCLSDHNRHTPGFLFMGNAVLSG